MGAGMTMAKRRLMLNEPHLLTAQSDGILTLDTDMRAPLKALRVGFEPVQEGEGDPSPENVRLITGWDGVEVNRTGKNLLGGETLADDIVSAVGEPSNTYKGENADGRYVSFAASRVISNKPITGRIGKFKENTVYTLICKLTRYQTGNSLNANMAVRYTDGTTKTIYFKPGTETEIVTVVYKTDSNKTLEDVHTEWGGGRTYLFYEKSGIFEGDISADEFESYHGSTVPISWASSAGTVYGGYLEWMRDGTVRVTKTHESVNLSSLTWQRRSTNPYRFSASLPSGKYYTNAVDVSQHKCSIFPTAYTSGVNSTKEGYLGNYRHSIQIGANNTIYLRFADTVTTLTELNAFLAETNPQYCYPLADPITYTLTPTEALRTLRGENNLWSDANGPISATFWKH